MLKCAPSRGAVARLGERRVRNAEVEGSIPFRSTNDLNELAAVSAAFLFAGALVQMPDCQGGCQANRLVDPHLPLDAVPGPSITSWLRRYFHLPRTPVPPVNAGLLVPETGASATVQPVARKRGPGGGRFQVPDAAVAVPQQKPTAAVEVHARLDNTNCPPPLGSANSIAVFAGPGSRRSTSRCRSSPRCPRCADRSDARGRMRPRPGRNTFEDLRRSDLARSIPIDRRRIVDIYDPIAKQVTAVLR